MAIYCTASNCYKRTTNLPTINSFTAMLWVYFGEAGNYYPFGFGQVGPSAYMFNIGRQTGDSGTYCCWNGSTEPTGTALANTTWYHFALICKGASAGDLIAYLNGVADITTDPYASVTADQVSIGSSPFPDAFSGNIAAFKFYSAVLTVAEIYNEMRFYVPIRTANLNTWCPFLNVEAVDYSGNGYDLTPVGTPTLADGPPIAWRPKRRNMIKVSGAAPPAGTPTPMYVQGPSILQVRRRIVGF